MDSKQKVQNRKHASRAGVLRTQQGSTIVEAAMVLPVVVLTLMVMIYGMIFLFDQTASDAAARRAVVREAGHSAGTAVLCSEGALGVPVSTGMYGLRPCAEGEKTAVFRSRMPGVSGRWRTLSAHQYIINEKTEIRLWDLFE